MSSHEAVNDRVVTVAAEDRAAAERPVPGDSKGELAATRAALLATYRELLGQIRAVAGDAQRSDEVARLAEAAGRLVHGGFAERLVFGRGE